MYCKNCGKELDSKATHCSVCGLSTDVATSHYAPSQQSVVNIYNHTTGYIHKKKWPAFWLSLLLGYLGIHRFYVGKVGTGIIWLLTGGVFGIGWLVDTIVILCGGFKDKAGQPLM